MEWESGSISFYDLLTAMVLTNFTKYFFVFDKYNYKLIKVWANKTKNSSKSSDNNLNLTWKIENKHSKTWL